MPRPAPAAPTTLQFDRPTGGTGPIPKGMAARRRVDAPACPGRAGRQAVIRTGLSSSQDEGLDTAGFRRQLQAPQRRRRQCPGLTQDRRQSAGSQTFLHGPEDVAVITAPHKDQIARMQTEGHQARRVQLTAMTAPEHRLSGGSCATEQRRRKADSRSERRGTDDLMHGSRLKAALGQGRVDLRHVQGKNIGASITSQAPGPRWTL